MTLYIITLTYTVPLEDILKAAPAHREFLDSYYADQSVLFSGIQCSKTGGIIVMRASDEATVEALIADDPFNQQKLATYQFVTFESKRHQPFVDEWIHGQ